MTKYIYLFLYLTLFWSCIEVQNSFTKLPPGKWRAVLELDNRPVISTDQELLYKEQGDIIPFFMEVVYDTPERFHINIINGEEVIKVEDILYGRDKSTAKDTITINFPIFDTYIKAIYEENMIEGRYYVNYREGYSIAFKAYYGQDYLFTTDLEKPSTDITGKWETTFEVGTEKEYPAIAELRQNKNELSGTFLTETGDYRFLTGQIVNNKFYLSTFDGAHAFLFSGKILEDESIVGSFRSGRHYTTTWEAKRNDYASLSDAFQITRSVNNEPFIFSLKNSKGEMISNADDKYQDKIKLVQIFGTWCPNCRDETAFLVNYLKENPDLPVEIFAIGFERYKEESKALQVLQRYTEKMNIPYEVLYGGYYEKTEAGKLFPQLNEIVSYPTLLFLDKRNEISSIYTGFAGPATSQYVTFAKIFKQEIGKLLDQ